MDQIEIEKYANKFSEKYIFEHKSTAKEAYIAAAKEYELFLSQIETALEACNNERKKYRDKMDFACAEVADRELKIKRNKDRFEAAKAAMQGFLSAWPEHAGNITPERVASYAISCADELLKALHHEKTHPRRPT